MFTKFTKGERLWFIGATKLVHNVNDIQIINFFFVHMK